MVNQFAIADQNRAATTALSTGKRQPAAPVAPSLLDRMLGRQGALGPTAITANRDAWSNALSQMQGVNATNPLVAAAQVAGMGLAGYEKGKASRENDAGTAEYKARLAQALSGKADNATLMGLATDQWADPASSALALKMWERNNPTEEQLQQRKANETALAASNLDLQNAQETKDRADQLRLGHESAVNKFDQTFRQQGGDLFNPEMQMALRQNGIEGVSPADTVRHQQIEPYINARDYENAFATMASPADKGDYIESNGALYNTRTGQWVQNPTGAASTNDLKEYQAAVQQGFNGTFMDYQTTMKKAGATQLNLDQKQQSSYDQERGKGFAATANDIDKQDLAAQRTINSIGAMQQMMADPKFYSGTGAEQVMALRRAIVAMGGDPNQVSSMETFNAQAKQLAVDAMGGSLGTGFSNADRDFVTGQVMSLDNTPQGNMALMEINRRVAQRKMQIAKMARDYEVKNGRIDAGFMQQLQGWSEQNPIFPQAPVKAAPAHPSEMSNEDLLKALGAPAGGN